MTMNIAMLDLQLDPRIGSKLLTKTDDDDIEYSQVGSLSESEILA